ncbi:uncharacterized protein YndB with AHSA1/START domain [Undibacterium sp. GrIS 1.8]|uniref:SRPBCC family protein n=1 Tax=Undibacterium sp. GrIS 1.8 TaxID=3143934 RepID=UPI003390BBD2
MNSPAQYLSHPKLDPALDLILERVIDIPPELVWRAWTDPEMITQWFTPVPWKTIACEIDLRPGGAFKTEMQSPEGQSFPNVGCYLEIIENKKLVWTSAIGPGFRPLVSAPSPAMTAIILLEPLGTGTKYTAIALHKDEQDRKEHEAMGFHEGWGKALDQLVAAMKRI